MSSEIENRIIKIDAEEEIGPEPELIEDIQEEQRQGRRLWLWGGVAFLVVAGGLLAASILGGDDEAEPAEATLNTAEVLRTDLADETTYDATLGRPVAADVTAGVAGTVTWAPEAGTIVGSGDSLFAVDDKPVLLLDGDVAVYRGFQLGDTTISIPAGRNGVLTWLVEAGTILESGDVFARIDEQPVMVLEGELPMYRTLKDDVEGTDVLQLEQALVDLGYDPDGDVTVDEEFTYFTEVMVEAWQEDMGLEETGRIEVGDLVFAPLPAQVLAEQAVVGTTVNSSTPILSVSGGDPLTGDDVFQLEQALGELGYDPGSIDGTYDIETARAVADWTDDVGHGSDGYLPVGSIVFNDGQLRTASVYAESGTAVSPSSPVISAANLETIVRLDLPAEDQDLLAVGSSVTIIMPDRSETAGTVTKVASVATAGAQGAQATFAVEIALDDPTVAEGLDEAPVDVRAVSETVENVLAVPVSALLALAEGGYAVEVVESTATRLVAVEPGFFADAMVEITGGVDAGDTVVVP
jgi:peptidoglycan hydrolase-like protein with peptidoglycan-binding domain